MLILLATSAACLATLLALMPLQQQTASRHAVLPRTEAFSGIGPLEAKGHSTACDVQRRPTYTEGRTIGPTEFGHGWPRAMAALYGENNEQSCEYRSVH